MPSPFPGMDPYLEHPAYWSGFHTRFIVALGAAMTHLLPNGYYADVEQHVWLQEAESDDRRPFAVPDAYVASRSGKGASAVATLTPSAPSIEVMLPGPAKRKQHRFIKIVDQPGNRVVTVIELLSPSNKESGDDRNSYIAKRSEYLATGTSLLEIDLLRDGERIPFGRPRPPIADYYALVSRAKRFPKASVWAFNLRDLLPRLPVPLKPEHDEIVLDLRPCLDRAYDDGGYDNRIDYTQPPAIELRPPDAEWAADLLKRPHKKKK